MNESSQTFMFYALVYYNSKHVEEEMGLSRFSLCNSLYTQLLSLISLPTWMVQRREVPRIYSARM